jgi:hypothetical protein
MGNENKQLNQPTFLSFFSSLLPSISDMEWVQQDMLVQLSLEAKEEPKTRLLL